MLLEGQAAAFTCRLPLGIIRALPDYLGNPMRALLLWICLAILPGLASAIDVATPGGTISITLPKDFTRLSKQEIQGKFSRSGQQLPVAVFGNPKRSSTMAVTWSQLGETSLTADQLPQLSEQLHDSYSQNLPGIHWISSEVRSINGKSWIFLENTTPGRDTRVHNEVYCTDVKGNLLMLNLNSTEAEHAGYVAAFKAAEQSLVVR